MAGTSIAYHLAQLGWDDVVLLDRDQLTSGSTFHSAGLVGQLRSSVTLTKLMMYGTDLYRGSAPRRFTIPGGVRSGPCRLASSRAARGAHSAGWWAATFGLPRADLDGHAVTCSTVVDRRRARCRAHPTDGQLNLPTCDGPRRRGGGGSDHQRYSPPASGSIHGPPRVDPRTPTRTRECEVVVNAGGIYSNEIEASPASTCRSCTMDHQ